MDNETWENWNNSLKEKLGDENYSVISADLGELLTRNNETLKTINDQKNEIAQLKNNNTKLSHANAQLLQQMPVLNINDLKKETEPLKEFSFKDQFDEKGNFKR